MNSFNMLHHIARLWRASCLHLHLKPGKDIDPGRPLDAVD
jgi:hypothetical protein